MIEKVMLTLKFLINVPMFIKFSVSTNIEHQKRSVKAKHYAKPSKPFKLYFIVLVFLTFLAYYFLFVSPVY